MLTASWTGWSGASAQDDGIEYGPKRGRRIVLMIVMLAIGALSLLGTWGRAHAAHPMADASYTAPAFLLGMGVLLAALLVRGAPRLTLSATGLTLRTVFRTRRFGWSSLGPFTVTRASTWRGATVTSASAAIVAGPGAGGTITLPDEFTLPLDSILQDIALYCHRDGSAPVFQDSPVRAPGVPDFQFAWMTAAMLGAFVAIFALEQRLAIGPVRPLLSPSVATLIAMGGLNWTLVQEGQWFRLFTAPLLHTGLPHLLGNAVAFVLAGISLERLVGRGWTFLIFALGALAGSAISLLVSSPAVVSVGASGGIMAMLAALFTVSFRMHAGRPKRRIQIYSARIAVPALIPFSHGAGALLVDYGAHFGGALFGLIAGLALLRSWQDDAPLPRLSGVTPLLAGLMLVGFGLAGAVAAGQYGTVASDQAERIPQAEIPHGDAEIAARAAALVARYPHDPAAYGYDGVARMQRGDLAGAERQLRAGLAQVQARPQTDRPKLGGILQATLAMVLVLENRRAEAEPLAQEACRPTGPGALPAALMASLSQAHLCASR